MLFDKLRKRRAAKKAKRDGKTKKQAPRIEVDTILEDTVNDALKSLNAPFYRVCSRSKKGYSWRRTSTACNPDYVNAYAVSENDVSQWLNSIYGISLKQFLDDPEKYRKKYDKTPKVNKDRTEDMPSINDLFKNIEKKIARATDG